MISERIWIGVVGFLILGVGTHAQADDRVSGTEVIRTTDYHHPRAKLVYGTNLLRGAVDIIDPRIRTLRVLSQAQVTVRNNTETRYTLEYKFDWEDDQGFSDGSTTTWHRFTLTPREIQTFRSTGKTPESTSIVFTVRLPDDVFIESDKAEENIITDQYETDEVNERGEINEFIDY